MVVSIGSNVVSLSVQRNLARTTFEVSKASERLSSGQRINSASDDAAGLAITSALQKDRLLAQTSQRNVSDGISMISIAAAGLSIQSEILYRMAELAEQSANGTYSQQQRQALQREYGSLMDEFDRIGESTEFNGIKLLRNRSGQGVHLMAGLSGADTALIEVNPINSHRYSGMLTQKSDVNNSGLVNTTDAAVYLAGRDPTSASYATVANGVFTGTENQDLAAVQFTNSAGVSGSFYFLLTRVWGDIGFYPKNSSLGSENVPAAANRQDIIGVGVLSTGETAQISVQLTTSSSMPLPQSYTAALNFATSGTTASIDLDLSGITFESYDRTQSSYSPSAIGFTNILNSYSARRAVEVVKNRTALVSQQAGQLGSIEARLQVAHSVLGSSAENFAAAAALINDADIAEDTAILARTQIIQQTAVALLGQANLAPQIALQLLSAA